MQKTNILKKIILFLCGVFISISCLAQYQFNKITTSDGLSLDIISCIEEDSDGRLYFGTGNGLNIYNGDLIKTVNASNTEGFGHIVKKVISISSSKLLIGTLDQGLFIYDKDLRKIIKVRLINNGVDLNLPILSLHDDNFNNIWIGTSNKGLFSIEKKTLINSFKEGEIPYKQYTNLKDCEINSIASSNESIWFGTRSKGLFSLSKKNITNSTVLPSLIPLSSKSIWSIKIYSDTIYIGTENGLNLFNLNTKQHQVLLKDTNDPTLSNNIIRDIVKDNYGTIWIGTQEDGLYSISFVENKTEIKHYSNNPTNSNTLNINKILSLHADKQNNLWIGTWNGGVNQLNIHSQQFINIRNKGKANDLSENMIWNIEIANKDAYWVGTHGSGICYYEKGKSYFTEKLSSRSLNSVSQLYFDTDNNILWTGTWGNGLKAFSFPNMKPLFENILQNSQLKNDRIYGISKDIHGVLWIGSVANGVFSINLKNPENLIKHFNNFNTQNQKTGLENPEIRAIIPDKNNTLWIGSLTNGLFKVITDNHGNIIQSNTIGLDTNLSNSITKIKTLFLESNHQLWIGEADGNIKKYNTITGIIETFPQAKSSITSQFTEDSHGNIWIATYNGILKYNSKNATTTTYLPEISFYSVLFNSKNGQILAGSNRGIFTFDSKKLKDDPFYPNPIFSELKIFNKTIIPGSKISKDNYLKNDINSTDTLVLPYTKNIFSIAITALSYTTQNKNIIQHKLENFEDVWNEKIGSSTTVEYTNLEPGTYNFKVKTANKDNVWNPEIKKLTIVILPPWWQTYWAYLGYLLILGAIGYLAFIIITDRIQANQALKIEKVKKEQNDILHEQKLSFFTSISHEFRTPLTLILGPLDNILEKTKKDTSLNRQLKMMQKNTNLLLQLVNQVLDFRKFEKDKTNLNVLHLNLNNFVLEILSQFEGRATLNNISIQFFSKKQNIILWADNDLLRKVLFNLLSNALRYNQSGGWIQISMEESSENIRLSIKDNGKGIHKKDLPKIFDRFFQSGKKIEGSSGIGLSLVKEMLALHSATIYAESQIGKGSEFIINFKSGKNHFQKSDFKSEDLDIIDKPLTEDPVFIESTLPKKKHSVLIIDDNNDIRQFIIDNLSSNFDTYDYNNATDALAFAKDHDISLIICDIMMPGMDGIEFCEHIKSDIKTSHIPVILLTAKTSTASKIEGYNKGADEYITKPFNTKILISRIQNIIQQRENLKKKIKTLNLEPSKIAPTSLDEQFLAKAINFIEENISNHDYSIDELSSNMGLSHDNFYRKIKNLSGMSAAQFIRMIKLKRAAQMLENTDFSVSEILYEVGFTNPSYFTKCFKEQFGISPTEYRKNN